MVKLLRRARVTSSFSRAGGTGVFLFTVSRKPRAETPARDREENVTHRQLLFESSLRLDSVPAAGVCVFWFTDTAKGIKDVLCKNNSSKF